MNRMEKRESPQRLTLFLVYIGLLALLVLTAIVAKMPLGAGIHDFLAFGISLAKTVLIVTIFMEVHYSRGVVRVFAGAGLVWLFLLFLLTLMDFFSRNWMY